LTTEEEAMERDPFWWTEWGKEMAEVRRQKREMEKEKEREKKGRRPRRIRRP